MLDKGDTVKIADFGIAKITSTEHLTLSGVVIGTPSYMSPEQLEELPSTAMSDQFSLAVVAFEMLTGRRPFQSDSLPALTHMIVNGAAPRLKRRIPNCRPLWIGLSPRLGPRGWRSLPELHRFCNGPGTCVQTSGSSTAGFAALRFCRVTSFGASSFARGALRRPPRANTCAPLSGRRYCALHSAHGHSRLQNDESQHDFAAS